MNLGTLTTAGALLLVTTSAGASPLPRPTAAYSADVKIETDATDGQIALDGRIHATSDKERREHTISGQKGVIIRRDDKNLTWVLLPGQRMYMERETDAKRLPGESWHAGEGDVKVEKVGPETIDGTATTKYAITSEVNGETSNGHVWLTKENIPIKMVGRSSGDGPAASFKVELRNLVVGAQDDALFELPADYVKFEMPQLPGMAGSDGTPPGMSPEDLEKMKQALQQRMQEMMEKQQGGAGTP